MNIVIIVKWRGDSGMTLEDDLFYACTNYCNSLNHYKNTREEIMFSFNSYTRREKERIIGFEEDRVRHAVDRLREVIRKIDDEDLK